MPEKNGKKYRAEANLSHAKTGKRIVAGTVISEAEFSKLPELWKKSFKPIEVVASVEIKEG